MPMYIFNGKPGFVVHTKSLSARTPLLLPYALPIPVVKADFVLFAAGGYNLIDVWLAEGQVRTGGILIQHFRQLPNSFLV